jgi:glycerol kinase
MKRCRSSRTHFAVIGIDQGSSSTKGVVLLEDGTILGKATWPIKTEGDRIVTFEHSPEEILSSVRAAVAWGRAVSGAVGLSVAGIGLATQRSGVLAWKKDGSPLSPILSWRDARGNELASRVISSSEIVAAIEARAGLVPNPFFAASKISLLQQRYSAAEANVTTLDSFLINGLVEGSLPFTDDSMASRTLLYDIAEHRWSPSLCNLWGVDLHRLPQIRPSVMVPGTFSHPPKVPGTISGGRAVLAALGDKEAAVVGALGFGEVEKQHENENEPTPLPGPSLVRSCGSPTAQNAARGPCTLAPLRVPT